MYKALIFGDKRKSPEYITNYCSIKQNNCFASKAVLWHNIIM